MGQPGLLALGKQAWNNHEFEVHLADPARACLRTTQTTKAAKLGGAAPGHCPWEAGRGQEVKTALSTQQVQGQTELPEALP